MYNFFEDSTATPSQWRLVLCEVYNGDNLSEAPTFDETRYASICVEVRGTCHEVSFQPSLIYLGRQLKFLYVAITRARNNLWIVDSSMSAEPMKVPEDLMIPKKKNSFLVQVYWSSKDQIEIRSSIAEIPRLAVGSNTEEWSKTGEKLVLASVL